MSADVSPLSKRSTKKRVLFDVRNGINKKHHHRTNQHQFQRPEKQQPQQTIPPNERREKCEPQLFRCQFKPEPLVQIQHRTPDDWGKHDEPFRSTRPRPKMHILQFVNPVNELFDLKSKSQVQRQNRFNQPRGSFGNVFPTGDRFVRNPEFIQHEKRDVRHQINERFLENTVL